MITVENALALIEEHLPKTIHQQDLILEDLIADRDYPPFNRVMMDGIAVSSEVYFSGRKDYYIAGVAPAGAAAATLQDQSQCFEVMTGAPLPVGADLVIPYEHIEIKDSIARIIIDQERVKFENVHLKGSDCHKGDVLCFKGSRINGPHMGIAASLGYTKFLTTPKPRINIISTGDELVAIDETPLDHQIRRPNSYALEASLRLHGLHDIELSHLLDDESAIEEHFNRAREDFDLLIYSGGVSKGKFDYLPNMWKKLGVKEIFHGISQRPGKPLWFGVDHKSSTAIFGLPGNPVPSLVCLHRYVLKGRQMYAVLDQEITFKKELTYFVPVTIHFDKNATLIASPLKIKNSGEFSALRGSDGFIELPKEQAVFRKGEAFLFHPWSPL